MNVQEYVDNVLSRLDALNEMDQLPRRTMDPITMKLMDKRKGAIALYDLHTALCAAYQLAYPQKYSIKNYDVLCYCLQLKADLDNNEFFRLFLLNEIIAITNRQGLRECAIMFKEWIEKASEEKKFSGISPLVQKYFDNFNEFNSFWKVSQARGSSKALKICKIDENSVDIVVSTTSDTTDGMFEYVDFSSEDSSIKLSFSGVKTMVISGFKIEDIPMYGLIHKYRIIEKDNCVLFEVYDDALLGQKRVDFSVLANKVLCSELAISQLS